jgi:hypothetical protein
MRIKEGDTIYVHFFIKTSWSSKMLLTDYIFPECMVFSLCDLRYLV